MERKTLRVAVISVHGCPLARLGEKDTGGMNVYLLQLARELGLRGLQMDVYTRYHDPADPQVVKLSENARVIHIKAGRWGETKGNIYPHLPEFIRNLCRFVKANDLRYDLVHSHYWLSGCVAMALKKQLSAPFIASFHTLGEAKRRALPREREPEVRIETEKKIMEDADSIIALSTEDKKQMIGLYEASSFKIDVIPSGVDLNFFKPLEQRAARSELGLKDAKIILCVGRIEPIKGIDLLLKTIPYIDCRERPRLIVVGGDGGGNGEIIRLRKIVGQLGIEEDVIFTGTVSHERLIHFYNAADICVIPSYYESFGLVAVESLACGTPVVASRVGGLLDTIKDGKNGYLVPWHCPEPFAERMELLLENEALRSRFGLQARASVERLSWPKVAERVLQVYNSVVESYKPNK